jgi:flagellar basal body P-ring formation protein FlgA
MTALRFFVSGLLLLTGCLRAAETAFAFERATLIDNLAIELAAHYAIPESLEVDLVRAWTAPAVEAADVPVTVAVLEYPEMLASSMLVRVRYRQEERILREDTLVLRVSLWREGMIAAIPLKRGDALSLNAVSTRRVDALRDRETIPTSAAGEDYVLAREIPAGRMLSWRDVVRRPLVHRGQMVEVQAGSGTLLVTIKALAMQDGAHGETVRLRNIESKRDFAAKVTAENRAEVRF